MPQRTSVSHPIPSRPRAGDGFELNQNIRVGLWSAETDPACLESCIPAELTPELDSFEQDTIPRLAHTPEAMRSIESVLPTIPTQHVVAQCDSRTFAGVGDESIHLIVTSPPYWTLKEYPHHQQQLGAIEDYEEFNRQLALVWEEAHRVLVPGGRLVVVVGDVNLARRRFGRHLVTCHDPRTLPPRGTGQSRTDYLAKDRQRLLRGGWERPLARQAVRAQRRDQERLRVHPLPAKVRWVQAAVQGRTSLVGDSLRKPPTLVPADLDRYRRSLHTGPPSALPPSTG